MVVQFMWYQEYLNTSKKLSLIFKQFFIDEYFTNLDTCISHPYFSKTEGCFLKEMIWSVFELKTQSQNEVCFACYSTSLTLPQPLQGTHPYAAVH